MTAPGQDRADRPDGRRRPAASGDGWEWARRVPPCEPVNIAAGRNEWFNLIPERRTFGRKAARFLVRWLLPEIQAELQRQRRRNANTGDERNLCACDACDDYPFNAIK